MVKEDLPENTNWKRAEGTFGLIAVRHAESLRSAGVSAALEAFFMYNVDLR